MAQASRRGHGALGFRDRIRPMRDLVRLTTWRKHCFLELRPGKLVTSQWSQSGNRWETPFREVFRGKVLDVVSVRTETEVLTRAESAALCDSTAGTFHYDPEEEYGGYGWDSPDVEWDEAGRAWDQINKLSVRLSDSSNPNANSIVALLLITVGTTGGQHPHLGPERLTDGGVNVWSSSSDLTHWTENHVGGSLLQESSYLREGSFAAKLFGTAVLDTAEIYQAVANMVASKRYRLAGYYTDSAGRVEPISGTMDFQVTVRDSAGLNPLNRDGRSIGGAVPFVRGTGGNYRRFLYDFVCQDATSRMTFAATVIQDPSRFVLIDGITLRRIYRFDVYEPRIVAGSFPSIQVGSDSVYPGTSQFGTASFRIANRDAWMEELAARFDWPFAEVLVYQGGEFPHESSYASPEPEGAVITADDWVLRFRGFVRTFDVDDGEGVLEVVDTKGALFDVEVPIRRFNKNDTPGVSDIDNAQPRPLAYGDVTGIRPARVGLTSEGFGVYEIMDPGPTTGPYAQSAFRYGIINQAWAYLDEEAAARKDAGLRASVSGDIATDIPITGQVFVASNIRVIRIVAGENDVGDIDFGGALTFQLTPGIYIVEGSGTSPSLVKHFQDVLQGISGGFTLTYDSAHKVTVSNGSNFTIKLSSSSAANRDRSAWRAIGFTGDFDLGPGKNFTAPTPLLNDVDREHILRLDIRGTEDDNTGSVTGVVNGPIELASDFLRHFLVKVMGYPLALLDLTSFVAARTFAPQKLSIYLGGRAAVTAGQGFVKTFGNVVEALEAGGYFDVVVGGDGKIYCRARTVVAPAAVADLADGDFLAEPRFRGGVDAEQHYREVRVTYRQDPATGYVSSVETLIPGMRARFRRDQGRTFPTFLKTDSDARDALLKLVTLASSKLRRLRFAVKGRGMESKLPGDTVTLTRSQGIGRAAATPISIALEAFRITSVNVNYLDMRVDLECHDQV